MPGHLNHMPSHIYVLCGDYEKARIVSEQGDPRPTTCMLDYAGSFKYYIDGVLPRSASDDACLHVPRAAMAPALAAAEQDRAAC